MSAGSDSLPADFETLHATCGFRYAEDEWRDLGAAARTAGFADIEHDQRARVELELIGASLVRDLIYQFEPQADPVNGECKARDRTAEDREAWHRVAVAGEKLQQAVADLEAGSSTGDPLWFLTMWDAREDFLAHLAAVVEHGRRGSSAAYQKVPGTRYPWRDAGIARLLDWWTQRGGALASSVNTSPGPLVRFLAAATAPAFREAGLPPMSEQALHDLVVKLRSEGGLALYRAPIT